jgi:hypothetical protein
MVPELEDLVNENIHSKDPAKAKAARELQQALIDVMKSDNHKWYLGMRDKAKQ